MSDSDYPQRPMASWGAETDRWLDDEHETFALDFSVMESV